MSMALQTTYSESPAVALEGQLLAGPSIKESVKNNDTVSIGFGKPVVYKPSGATSDLDVCLPANSTDKLRGILFRSDSYERAWTDDQGTHGVLDSTGVVAGTLMDIARIGQMWVVCHTGCAPSDRLYVSYGAATTYSAAAQFGNAAEGSNTIDATTKGEWKTTAAALGLAILDFNFTNK